MAISITLFSFGHDALAQSDEKLAVLETNLGTMVIEFFPNDAPNHVNNFITLAESGFYDGTIFHRIIPGFMIQGGDPNTIDGDPSTWGLGGPAHRVNAEFNTIKHDRGIVSMARSPDPNSAGSQFFIVHSNSNFLDEQYTVFGRIITDESFDTLDKIASVETGDRDNPTDTEKVKITKITIVNADEVADKLDLGEPERTQSASVTTPGNQKFESDEHEISLSVPEGWLLQQREKLQEDSPDVVAVGPKVGVMNPVISLTVQLTNEKTFDDIIAEKNEQLNKAVESGSLSLISQEKITIDGNDAYAIDAEGIFSSNNEQYDVKFKEIMIYDVEKTYTIAYANGIDDFDSQIPRFEETVDSFEILSKVNQSPPTDDNASGEQENGGCLIATATYGSELAPQVQQLREIRDTKILQTSSGLAFMTTFNQIYYSFSPSIADLERQNPLFKETVKLLITPMLSTLSILNHEEIDSEFEIVSYGIGVIMMNIGMYFALPAAAVIVYRFRK